jgi:glycosyltransferase involved in cell wall biosynthesis
MTKNLLGQIVVVLSTHNGSAIVAEVLDGYCKVSAPTCAWRIVVVDNASTDNTPEVLKRYESVLPLEVLHEPAPGKNKALNRALRYVALGADLYVFTDDDAIPKPSFLIEWEKVMRGYPDIEMFGATILPAFQADRPKWLKNFAPWYAELYAENIREDGPIGADKIFGPNMAVRRSVFAAGKMFNENIGPNSSAIAYPMGSETEFCMRVALENGASAWFVSRPEVQHIVRPNQMTKAFVKARAYRHGRGVAARHALLGPVAPVRLKGIAKQMLRIGIAALGQPEAFWNLHWNRGYRSAPNG